MGSYRNAAPRDLVGKRILLLMLSRAAPEDTYLLLGTGRTAADQLEVVPDQGQTPVSVSAMDVHHNTFGSAVLPRLVSTDAHVPLARQLAAEADCCIAFFVETAPPGANCIRGLFGGMAVGSEGQVHLMQVR
jgi:hypothetical protein